MNADRLNGALPDLDREHAVKWQERIVVDPRILVGKPVIKGTRLAVEFLLELLAEGWTQEQILENYPPLPSRRPAVRVMIRLGLPKSSPEPPTGF